MRTLLEVTLAATAVISAIAAFVSARSARSAIDEQRRQRADDALDRVAQGVAALREAHGLWTVNKLAYENVLGTQLRLRVAVDALPASLTEPVYRLLANTEPNELPGDWDLALERIAESRRQNN